MKIREPLTEEHQNQFCAIITGCLTTLLGKYNNMLRTRPRKLPLQAQPFRNVNFQEKKRAELFYF